MALMRRSAILAAALSALAGCDRPTLTKAPPPDAASGYLQPPRLIGATQRADGALVLTGSAPPGAEVRLRAPEGDRISARADSDRRWTLALATPSVPRLFAVEAETPAGRVVKGEGALALLPAAPWAVVLRSGYATRAPSGARDNGLHIVAMDFDGSGFAVDAFAPPSTPVRLMVDGQVLSVGQSDPTGAIALLAVDPRHSVRPGRHTVRLETPAGLATGGTIVVDQPRLPPERVYSAAVQPGGWRIDWRPASGGVQASRVFATGAAP